MSDMFGYVLGSVIGTVVAVMWTLEILIDTPVISDERSPGFTPEKIIEQADDCQKGLPRDKICVLTGLNFEIQDKSED